MEGQRRREEDRKRRELWFCLRRTLEVWGSLTGTSCRRGAVTRRPVGWRVFRVKSVRNKAAVGWTFRFWPPSGLLLPNPTNILNIPTSSSLSSRPGWSGNPFPRQQEASGVRALRALRHPYRDFLVPYLTVNGFGLVINSDEWGPIHNPLCTWPGAVSVTGPKKRHSQEKGRPTTAPCWREFSLAAQGKVYFWLRICTKTELSWGQRGLQGTDGRTAGGSGTRGLWVRTLDIALPSFC